MTTKPKSNADCLLNKEVVAPSELWKNYWRNSGRITVSFHGSMKANFNGRQAVIVFIAPGAVVCKDCELQGEITIGSRCVIHPKARIIAEAGPIIIGECNLIEEQVQILNVQKENPNPDVQTVMVIGANNVFEVGAHVESLKIGDNNVLESKCKVGRNTELTTGCVIGAKCEITCNEVIPENTVIYGSQCERRLQSEKPSPQTLQLEFLTKILPNYHHLRKPTRTEAK